MDKYTEAALKIIKEQELLIGPIAKDLASRAAGINISNGDGVEVTGNPQTALENLVAQYQVLFGQTSIEVSKNALKGMAGMFSANELPNILK